MEAGGGRDREREERSGRGREGGEEHIIAYWLTQSHYAFSKMS